ncbi:MAG TPA: TIR domain-containing protein [Chthoniobacterales bacterium]|nr:TIR domain-containing protein [Chthoniobacterales bacterium]
MRIKPHLFIGSSKEGLFAAQALKSKLSAWADCDIWNEPGVFELNKGYLENLLDRLNLYEYGIMVATGDDATKSRGETKMVPRDNVVFELGLFMGRLGRDRTFFVFEKGSKLPSDLLGITLPQFPKRKGRAQDQALEGCAEMIETHVKSRSGIFEGGIFPSVPLAFGYFHNFVEVVCRRLATAKAAKINGKVQPITDFKLLILIPDDLADDMKAKVAAARNIRNWQQISVEAPETRSYDFFADVKVSASKTAFLQDVPTTLLSLHQTITEFLKLSQVGTDEREKLVEAREIRRFKLVLDHLIRRASATKGKVSTEIVNI